MGQQVNLFSKLKSEDGSEVKAKFKKLLS